MGYPDLQDGRPPRSRVGAGLSGSPDPAEMPGEEETGYRSPLVLGADGGARRGNGPADRPAYPSDPGGAGGGRAQGGSGFSGPPYRGDSGGFRNPGPSSTSSSPENRSLARGAPGYGGDAGGTGSGTGAGTGTGSPGYDGPGYDGQRPGRIGAHRAVPRTGAQPATRPAAGPQDQWLSSPPSAGPDSGPSRSVTGPQHATRPAPVEGRSWPSSLITAAPENRSRPPGDPATAARPTGRRRASSGPDDRAGALHRRPTDGGRGWPGSPAPTGPRVPGPQVPGPQEPARPRPDNPDDEPGLAVTRERPGARRAAPPGGAPPPAGRLGPIRGYPPRPGQPDPVYPPGQFSPWNRASTRAAWLGVASARDGPAAADAEPGYSALALSDAAADLTSTQTWAVIDDEPPPSPSAAPGTRRDWGSHAEEASPGWQRSAGGRTTGGSAATARGAGPGDRLGHRPGAAGFNAGGQGAAGLAAGEGLHAAAGEGLHAVAGGSADTGRAPRRPGGPAPGLAGASDRLDSTASRLGGTGGRLGSAAEGLGGMGARNRVEPGGLVARRAAERQVPTAFGETEPGRRSRAAARVAADSLVAADDNAAVTGRRGRAGRRSGKRGGRHNIMMAGLLLAPVLVVVLVVGGYVYLSSRHTPAAPRTAASIHPSAAPGPAAAGLGPWKHIESRSQDPVPLTVTELFPAKFAQGGEAGTLTVSKSGSKCPREVIGSKLASAIRKAGCTQVLRASYLSTDRKIMATVGVLNLANATAAEKAGKAAGAMEFIKQLPSAHGPTRNIAKGTGIVEAEFKGHYLILTWTEFANLHAPSGKKQKQQLVAFSAGLVAGTANVSLTTRMVTGHPPGATSNS